MALEPGDDKRCSLYKYKTITSHTIDMIENNRISFSYPSDFNDPYDSYINTVYKGSIQDFENWIQQLPGTDQDRSVVRSLLQAHSYDGSVLLDKEPKNDTKEVIVLCLAEDPDNLVLCGTIMQIIMKEYELDLRQSLKETV